MNCIFPRILGLFFMVKVKIFVVKGYSYHQELEVNDVRITSDVTTKARISPN